MYRTYMENISTASKRNESAKTMIEIVSQATRDLLHEMSVKCNRKLLNRVFFLIGMVKLNCKKINYDTLRIVEESKRKESTASVNM